MKQWRHRLWLAVALLAIFALVGCTATQPDTTQPDTTQPDTTQPEITQPEITQPETAQPETVQPETIQPQVAEPTPQLVDVTQQMEVISQNRHLWRIDDQEGLDCYAVTDLDQNGRLELISSVNQGSGLYSYSTYWEVNEVGDGLELCQNTIPQEESQADIVIGSTYAYFDGQQYHYIFWDSLRVGMAESHNIMKVVTLADGEITEEVLGTLTYLYDQDGNVTERCTDASGQEITPDQLMEMPNVVYEGMKMMEVGILWFTGDDIQQWDIPQDWTTDQVASRIDASYGSFTLTVVE